MAEILPIEGRDYMLGVIFKGATQLTNHYLGLFTSQSATTVPAETAVLATATGVTEASFTSYARVAIPTSDWGSAANATIWSQAVRALTAAQKAFVAAGAAYSGAAINGFFVATALTGGVAVYYSNFDDSTAIPSLDLGSIVKVTPQFGLGA